jgi:acyl-CoA synthetase (NDP forming)
VPAAAVPAVARECGAAGVRALVVVSAGFAETGPEGAARQAALLEACRASGMRLVGPNSLGVLNTAPEVALGATFSLRAPPRGRLAVATQSGAFGIAAVAEAARRGLGLSSFVSMGNKADLSTNDLMQYWEGDTGTGVVLLYLESFGNPRRFGRIARRVAVQKPVIAVKSGRSAAGARAAASHTGALLAASDAAYDALFRHAGVIRAGTIGEQFDIATLLARQPLPTGDRVAILTNAGGPGIACADACEAAGLRVEPLSERTRQRLSHLPPEASLANPVDMIASAGGEDYRRSAVALAADPDVDAIVAIFIPALATGARDAARGLEAAAAATRAGDTTLLAVWIAEDDRSLAALGAGEAGVPAYRTPEEAVRALAQVREYARRRARSAAKAPPTPAGLDPDAAAATLARALAEGDAWLPPERVAALLGAYGIPQARSRTAGTAAGVTRCAAELDGPLAVKAIAPGLVHKSDVGGVRLGVAGAAAAGRAARAIATALRGAGAEPTGFVVQEMAPEGVEMLVGVAGDPDLGPVVVCAAGGRAVELLGDAQMRLAPLTARDATEMIRELRTFPLLDGYRGAPPADVAALEDVLLRVSALAADHPEIAELDCNPVLVAPGGATVVDARVRVAPVAPARPLPSLDR